MSIKKEDLPGFIDNLISDYEVVGPKAKDFKYAFQKIASSSEIALDYPTTLLPPKKYFLPQKEVLFTYKLEGEITLEPNFDETRRVIFGAHSCDIHGVQLLDEVLAENNSDAHYLSRRKNSRIIGIDCKTPCWEHSFCKSMGTLKPGGGYDIFLTNLDDIYAAQVATREGEELLSYGKFIPADYAIKERYFLSWQKKLAEFPDRIKYDTELLPNLLADAYDDIIWDALEERCFDCGACTVVCPTCYCFDVQDETDMDMKQGVRCRRWDSCQLQDFAAVAGGVNFRGKRSDRLRHRFFRKGKYFKEKFGRFGCVGCGRCGRACLVHIDVMEVFNQLK
jgi:sulfhydrogenase subunit beta (sulfur reductase)